MLDKKIKLNDAIRNFISFERKSKKMSGSKLTADYISEQIGRTKSWLSQVENGRLKTVKTVDLTKAFMIIKNTSYEQAYEYLNIKIGEINAELKNNIIDETGEIIDFAEHLVFSQIHGHLWFATKNFNNNVRKLIDLPIEDIKADLKKTIKYWHSFVIYWINRAISDVATLFNDEVSLKNLYLIIKTSYDILAEYNEDYGIDIPYITSAELSYLQEKLNDDHIIVPRTIIKPLNEYPYSNIEQVILHYEPEDYLMWVNHRVYIGDDPFPMKVKYVSSPSDEGYTENYSDITTATGLSEEQYLYIIKQLCIHFDTVYKQCRYYITEYKNSEEESTEYFNKYKDLEEENKKLKEELFKLRSSNKN